MEKEINDSIIDKAIDRYYEVIKLDRHDDSRKNSVSQARMALSNTLSWAGIHNDDIAKIINRHRTSVCHHLKHHDCELKHWHGYKGKFTTCKLIVGVAAQSSTAFEKVEILKLSQDHLKKEIDVMENQIEKLENLIQ